LPYPPRRLGLFLLAHTLLAAAYPVLWIALVAAPRIVQTSIAQGSLSISLPPEHVAHWHLATGAILYVTLVIVTYTIDRAKRAESRLRESELAALRAQLQPHFLFNTMHSLLALVRSEAAAAAPALEQFTDLLRYTLSAHRLSDQVRFEEEWAFTERYLDLERLRLGDRLRVELDIDEEAHECLVPAFVLQPLVENAVRCAVAPRAEGGTIRIRARCIDDELALEVGDDGPGSSQPQPSSGAFGLGLRAARERVTSRYGARARFDVASVDEGFLVSIRLPVSSAV